MKVFNATITGFHVVIHWSWGRNYRFQEKREFTVSSLDEADIKESIATFARQVSERYCFDCGRIDMPMNPSIDWIDIQPVAKTEQFYSEDWLPNQVFRDYEAHSAQPKQGE